MSNAVAVEARGVRFAYRVKPVLDGVDLTLAAGEVFGVVGPDGAGKSTLLRLLIGQLVPIAGSVTVLGQAATETSLRRRIAYMPQSFGQYLDLSVEENLEFFAELHALDRPSAQALIDDLLARTGLGDFRRRRAGQLSGGMMQKLALACALVSRPRVMFLDEPTTGVDPVSRRAFWQLLDQVRAEDVAIVYATANMDEAERCDRVGMLVGGRFVHTGPPLELIRRVAAPFYELSGRNARGRRGEVRALAPVELVFPVGETLKVWLADHADEAAFRKAIDDFVPGLASRRLRPSLHDVALRDLALAGDGADGGAAGRRH
ncbi:MAG TPA: ABC transporter ATP-binding protein [Casimicrobiaceae bacterium]|nr:ABC transporter ATP-binding protein [Casimicrobiaceae bacterium]